MIMMKKDSQILKMMNITSSKSMNFWSHNSTLNLTSALKHPKIWALLIFKHRIVTLHIIYNLEIIGFIMSAGSLYLQQKTLIAVKYTKFQMH